MQSWGDALQPGMPWSCWHLVSLNWRWMLPSSARLSLARQVAEGQCVAACGSW